MKNRFKIGSLAVLLLGLLGFDHAVNASIIVIVSDSFSGTNGATIHARTPNTADLPGGTWYSVGTGIGGTNNPFAPSPPTISGNTVQVTVNNSAYISIQSNGGYTKPTVFTISADLKVGTISGNNLGVGLGFNDDKTAFDVSQEISLSINGTLSLKQVPIASYNSADFGGNAFNPNSFYHLSYTVDTSTGGVSNITLSNGSGSQSYTVLTAAFTNAKTAFAGIFSNSSSIGTSGNIDNFEVTTPEPASVALVAAGAALLVRRRRRN